MDFYDIVIILLVALFYFPGLAGKKKNKKQVARQRDFPEIVLENPEFPVCEHDNAGPEEFSREAPEDSIAGPGSADSGSLSRPETFPLQAEEKEQKVRIDPKNLIVYSALMNPKFKTIK